MIDLSGKSTDKSEEWWEWTDGYTQMMTKRLRVEKQQHIFSSIRTLGSRTLLKTCRSYDQDTSQDQGLQFCIKFTNGDLANIQHNKYVIITSKQYFDAIIMCLLCCVCCFDVMITCLLRCVSAGNHLMHEPVSVVTYRQVSNISRTKSQHSNDSHSVLRPSLLNPLKPDVKSRMEM